LVALTFSATVALAAGQAVQANRSAALEGRVVDASGQPVARAAVSLRDELARNVWPSSSAAAPSVLAGADGRFVFEGVRPGRYRLVAEKAGYVSQAYGARRGSTDGVFLDVSPGRVVSDINIAMTRLGAVSGRVLDEAGEPLRGSNVRVYRRGYSGGEATLVSVTATTTDAFGNYSISLAPDAYYLAAIPPRVAGSGSSPERYVTTYYPASTDAAAALPLDVSPGGTWPSIDIWLRKEKAVRVRGHIAGAPVPALLILTPRGQYTPQASQFVSPGEDGTFEFTDIAAGHYTLVAASNTRLTDVYGWMPVDVFDTDVDGIVLSTETTFELAGRVRLAGSNGERPVGGIRVVLTPEGLANAASSAISEADGSLVLEKVRSSHYSVAVGGLPTGVYLAGVGIGSSRTVAESIDVRGRGSAPLDIVLKSNPGVLSGTVQSPDGKDSPAVVTIVPRAPRRPGQQYLYKRVSTDDRGSFVVNDLPPSEYDVYAWESLEPGAEFVETILGKFKPKEVSVTEGSSQAIRLTLIPHDDLP
jgi:protocatechuate 3,4-dioxygenase beta subunit